MTDFKKWTNLFFIIILLACLTMAGLIYCVDPYFQYHEPLSTFPYVIDDQLTQNPGLARNLKYDAVILGSSVTVNFDAVWFNEDFNVTAIKLPYNGAYPKDYANILSQINMSDNDLKYVFWTMDVGSFSGTIEETKYPIKKNLYDTNPFNDISYLLNKDVLFEYIVSPVLNKQEPAVYANSDLSLDYGNTINNAYCSYQDLHYSKEDCLNNFSSVNPDIDINKIYEIVDNSNDLSILFPDEMLDEDTFLNAAKENLNTNILPFIESHPDTKFIISFPPYSILNWCIYANNGSYNALMKEYALVIDELSKYDNVTLYYFCDEKDIIYNLDLYTDALHYNRDINHWMEQEFANPCSKYIISPSF